MDGKIKIELNLKEAEEFKLFCFVAQKLGDIQVKDWKLTKSERKGKKIVLFLVDKNN